MWHSVMNWLPDVTVIDVAWNVLMGLLPDGRIGEFEIRDWLNVALGVLGVYLAFFANKIAKKQDQILDEQRAKKPEFVVTALGPTFNEQFDDDFNMHLFCKNVGPKAAVDMTWMVALGDVPLAQTVDIYTEQGGSATQLIEMNSGRYRRFSVDQPIRLFPGLTHTLAVVRVTMQKQPVAFHILWKIHCADGSYPDGTAGRIDITRDAEGRVTCSAPHQRLS